MKKKGGLESIFGRFGGSWGVFGVGLGGFGLILGHFGRVLGGLGSVLGGLEAVLGRHGLLGLFLPLCRRVSGGTWANFGNPKGSQDEAQIGPKTNQNRCQKRS